MNKDNSDFEGWIEALKVIVEDSAKTSSMVNETLLQELYEQGSCASEVANQIIDANTAKFNEWLGIVKADLTIEELDCLDKEILRPMFNDGRQASDVAQEIIVQR